MTFHPDSNLPDCMMPDGGQCCAGHAAVCEDWHKQRREIERLQETLARSSERIAITPEMIERGMEALHVASTYRGYNKETLDREFVRMESIYRAHVTAVLNAALVGDAPKP